ncbi:helix-turn-helix domain-containing protein [Nocardia puris]|uniref:helix-turn-helix domain-containing protein n=1 Tax=Nocardia puris TaxID=208602 RepID=UPI0034DDB75E
MLGLPLPRLAATDEHHLAVAVADNDRIGAVPTFTRGNIEDGAVVYTDAFIDQIVEMYRAGKSYTQIGAILGKDPASLRDAIQRRGIELPRNTYRSPKAMPAPPDIASRYAEGQSVLALAEQCGVSRRVVDRWLTEAGVTLRSRSEAGKVRAERMSPAERRRQAAAANTAARGRVRNVAELQQSAETRQRKAAEGVLRRSPMEIQLGRWLQERAVNFIPEQVIAGYNVDFGIKPVAVELLGGSWHAAPSRRAHHAKRTHDILNAGWSMVYIWSTHHVPVTPAGADELVTHIQQASRHPSPIGEYRVLRGDGQLVACGGDEGDEFALVVPSIADLSVGA